jgi:hypothetical protein
LPFPVFPRLVQAEDICKRNDIYIINFHSLLETLRSKSAFRYGRNCLLGKLCPCQCFDLQPQGMSASARFVGRVFSGSSKLIKVALHTLCDIKHNKKSQNKVRAQLVWKKHLCVL